MNPIFLGGALGALAMYFLDPREGRRRRARTRDKMVHAGKKLNEAGKVTARDTVHRARGVLASTRKLFKHEEVPDEVPKDLSWFNARDLERYFVKGSEREP